MTERNVTCDCVLKRKKYIHVFIDAKLRFSNLGSTIGKRGNKVERPFGVDQYMIVNVEGNVV